MMTLKILKLIYKVPFTTVLDSLNNDIGTFSEYMAEFS